MPARLFLLPNLLDESLEIDSFFPSSVKNAVKEIDGLIAESEKMARRYLRKFLSHEEMAKMNIALLNEHTKEIHELIQPIEKGETWGLISDAGLPCIADPGSDLVWLAHKKKIEIKAFVGPSSILMALQLSGFSGQKFTFHGYLSKDENQFKAELKKFEKWGGTHIWIEAPYRSAKNLSNAISVLNPNTKFCAAIQLTTQSERVISQKISEWKKSKIDLGKEMAVFLISN